MKTAKENKSTYILSNENFIFDDKIIQTAYGKIHGIKKDSCIQYLGIPFAKPPVDDLAFRHPVAPDKWKGIYEACAGKHNPVQKTGRNNIQNQSQDCLYLNIFVPETDKKNLPVMVWFYGGSYEQGTSGTLSENSCELFYNMSLLANRTECIVVTFNYRENLYGFLNLNFISSRFDKNIGLYDQMMALTFVKENIEAFGGNKNNVTLFGQSAGAACILALMSMEKAQNLFDKAIVMSACAEHFFTEEESEKYTKLYLKTIGVKENNISEILSVSTERVQKANKKFDTKVLLGMDLRCAFSPVIDGKDLKCQPEYQCQKCTKPLLIGCVAEEANGFTLPLPLPVLHFMAKGLKLKLEKSELDFKHKVSRSVTKLVYEEPVDKILENYAGKAWRYQFNYATPEAKESGLGCYHASDVAILLGTNTKFQKVDDDETRKVTEKLQSVYGNFAWNGEPGWEIYSVSHKAKLLP